MLELTNNNSKFLKELEQKVIIITKLEKELSSCEKIITSLEADRASNQILFAEFDCKNNELQDKNKMLENERDKLTAERNQFASELSVLHKDMQELNNKLIHLKENNSELLSDIDKKQFGRYNIHLFTFLKCINTNFCLMFHFLFCYRYRSVRTANRTRKKS